MATVYQLQLSCHGEYGGQTADHTQLLDEHHGHCYGLRWHGGILYRHRERWLQPAAECECQSAEREHIPGGHDHGDCDGQRQLWHVHQLQLSVTVVKPPVYPPIVLTCSSNITVAATSTSGAQVFAFTLTCHRWCCTAPNVNVNPPSGSTFPVGLTTVFVTASDTCGDSTNCSFTVTVVEATDHHSPARRTSRSLPPAPAGVAVFYTVTATGGCSAPLVNANPPSGSTFPVGTTTVNVTASDNCGTFTNCSFTVTVATPPIVLTCSTNITVAATSTSGAQVFYNLNATGGCTLPNVNANPPSGSTFSVGTTTVFATASDTCGDSTNCSFTVTVVKPPIVLNCSTNITVTATGSGSHRVL